MADKKQTKKIQNLTEAEKDKRFKTILKQCKKIKNKKVLDDSFDKMLKI